MYMKHVDMGAGGSVCVVVSSWLAEQGVDGLNLGVATTISEMGISCSQVAIWLKQC